MSFSISAPFKFLSGKTKIITDFINVDNSGKAVTLKPDPNKALLLKTLEVKLGTNCSLTSVVIDGVNHYLTPDVNGFVDLEDIYGAPLYVSQQIVVSFTASSGSADCRAIARGIQDDNTF